VAFIAHREDHHPRLEVGYRTCVVHYHTIQSKAHDNDFICAASRGVAEGLTRPGAPRPAHPHQ